MSDAQQADAKSAAPAQFDPGRVPSVAYNQVLKGQPAIVTGANSGIGEAVALGLARAGADVAVNYVTHPETAEEVAHKIEGFGRRAIVVKADVSNEDEVEAMYAKAIAVFGTLHISVSNAGLQADSPLVSMTLAQWEKVISVNLTGQFLCQRAAAREFLKRGVVKEVSLAAGKMICMSSVHQQIAWAGHVNYASSKGGILMLTAEHGPGARAALRARQFDRPRRHPHAHQHRGLRSTPEAYADLMTLVPYKRIGEPDDIAQAAVWLASDAADYVTGTTMFVDGGMTLYPGFATGG